MIALNRGRKVALTLVAAATLGTVGTPSATAQQGAGRATATAPPAQSKGRAVEPPKFQEVRIPANNTDPIAVVNGEVITRQQLADECVARKGQEILETLIARRLIEQAMRSRKLEITAPEIDDEIDKIAMKTAGVTRDVWLLNLDKERGISPAQYRRDIIYPALALRKLAISTNRVQVTEQDIKDAFEANYGPRLRCRMIMCKNDPQGQRRSGKRSARTPAASRRWPRTSRWTREPGPPAGSCPTRSPATPIPRKSPTSRVRAARRRRVQRLEPRAQAEGRRLHRTRSRSRPRIPTIIMKREELLPGTSGSLADPNIRTTLQAQMFEVKLNDAVRGLFEDMMKASAIDNKLTGQVKMAREEDQPDFKAGLDEKVQRMSVAGRDEAGRPDRRPGSPSNVRVTAPASTNRTPAGIPADAAVTATKLQNTIKTAPRPPPRNARRELRASLEPEWLVVSG